MAAEACKAIYILKIIDEDILHGFSAFGMASSTITEIRASSEFRAHVYFHDVARLALEKLCLSCCKLLDKDLKNSSSFEKLSSHLSQATNRNALLAYSQNHAPGIHSHGSMIEQCIRDNSAFLTRYEQFGDRVRTIRDKFIAHSDYAKRMSDKEIEAVSLEEYREFLEASSYLANSYWHVSENTEIGNPELVRQIKSETEWLSMQVKLASDYHKAIKQRISVLPDEIVWGAKPSPLELIDLLIEKK